jgi:hypothetical protein
MSASDIATILASYTAVAVTIGGVAWKLFKTVVKQAIEANTAVMEAPINELRHNGGSSLLDVVKLQILPIVQELRENQIVISEKVARLEGRFEQHIDDAE